MKPHLCLYFFILFLFSIKSTAQKIPLDFTLVPGKNGLSLGKINGITQDKWGYMWFVDQTNKCLIRFDGYRMKTYRNDPLDTNSIDGVNYECIAADSTGVSGLMPQEVLINLIPIQENLFISDIS
jgi:hypothetical protein